MGKKRPVAEQAVVYSVLNYCFRHLFLALLLSCLMKTESDIPPGGGGGGGGERGGEGAGGGRGRFCCLVYTVLIEISSVFRWPVIVI